MGKFEFSLTLKTQEVTIDDKTYTIKELDGLQKGKYLNSMGSRIVLNDLGKVVGFKDYAGMETTLLALCLFNDANILVDSKTMQAWPSSVLGGLFDIAQEVSGLNEKGKKQIEEEAKNS